MIRAFSRQIALVCCLMLFLPWSLLSQPVSPAAIEMTPPELPASKKLTVSSEEKQNSALFTAENEASTIGFFDREKNKIGYLYKNKAQNANDFLEVELKSELPAIFDKIKYSSNDNQVSAAWSKMEVRYSAFERYVKADYILLGKPSSEKLEFVINHNAENLIANPDGSL
ncbi:MAG: hypothetical protein ACD_68C00086G0001, partial [uncultured bacterium]